jgi:hypothetical protein
MKLEDLVQRADELIEIGQTLSHSAKPVQMNSFETKMIVNVEGFAEFRTSSLSFVNRVFGGESPNYVELDAKTKGNTKSSADAGIGILKACRSELAGGWLFTTRGIVSSELFSDFLEMAEHLLSEHYKDPAAVMIGSVLEEHLRQLCQRSVIPVTSTKSDGSIVPKTADSLNAELAKENVYLKLDQKNVTAWLGLRNSAAHGKYSEYKEEQVELMLRGVSDFIARVGL